MVNSMNVLDAMQLEGRIGCLSTDQGDELFVTVLERQTPMGEPVDDAILYSFRNGQQTARISLRDAGLIIDHYDDTLDYRKAQLLKRLQSSAPYTDQERQKMREQYEAMKDQSGESKPSHPVECKALWHSDHALVFIQIESNRKPLTTSAIVDLKTRQAISKAEIKTDLYIFHPVAIRAKYLVGSLEDDGTPLACFELPGFKPAMKFPRTRGQEDEQTVAALFNNELDMLVVLRGVPMGGFLDSYKLNIAKNKMECVSRLALDYGARYEPCGLCINERGEIAALLGDLTGKTLGRVVLQYGEKTRTIDLEQYDGSRTEISLGPAPHACVFANDTSVLFAGRQYLAELNTTNDKLNIIHQGTAAITSLAYLNKLRTLAVGYENGCLEFLEFA